MAGFNMQTYRLPKISQDICYQLASLVLLFPTQQLEQLCEHRGEKQSQYGLSLLSNPTASLMSNSMYGTYSLQKVITRGNPA